MKHRSAAARFGVGIFVMLALAAACIPWKPSIAQQVPPSATFSFTATGQTSPILLLQHGEGICSVVVDNIGGASPILTPQTTSDPSPTSTSQWNTATNIGTGSISSAGTFTGAISQSSNSGLTGFQLVATNVSGATVTGKIVCTTAQGAGTFSGSVTAVVSPIPLPVTLPTCAGSTLPCVYPSGQPGPAATDAQGIVLVHPTEVPALPTSSPGQITLSQPIKATNGTTILQDTWPDQTIIGSNETGAGTYLIISGSANTNMYVFYIGIQSTGTNTAATVTLKYGGGATCSTTGPVTFPTSLGIGAAAGITTVLVGGVSEGSTGQGLGVIGYLFPAATPWIIASGATAINVCVVTTSATESWQPITMFSVHPN